MRPAPPMLRTAPVLAILFCHNEESLLPLALSALRRSSIRPRHVLAIDAGSTDRTPALLAEAADPAGFDAQPVLDGVIPLSNETGFAEAVANAVERWGDPGAWIWLLHDDCAPESDCLDTLLRAADASPSAKVLGPLALDWSDPRLIVEAGLSTDASGHRQQVTASGEQSTEVLAVPSAGALIDRRLWDELGGFDPGFPLLREDVDFGWRVNAASGLVLSVPPARLRHARGDHRATAGGRARFHRRGREPRARPARVPRQHLTAFVPVRLGAPADLAECARSCSWYCAGPPKRTRSSRRSGISLVGARAQRGGGSVRGLVMGRFTRLRNAVRAGVVDLLRRRVANEAAPGRVPEQVSKETAWITPEAMRAKAQRPVGPDALPLGAVAAPRLR